MSLDVSNAHNWATFYYTCACYKCVKNTITCSWASWLIFGKTIEMEIKQRQTHDQTSRSTNGVESCVLCVFYFHYKDC